MRILMPPSGIDSGRWPPIPTIGEGVVGARLIRHAEGVLRDAGEGGIWADARKVALGFYAGLGWDVSGPFYTVPKRGLHRLVWTRFDE